MAAKLYPPVIAGTIPAFSGTSIEVPFSMNRAVGASEFNGFALKIKKVSGTLVGTVLLENQANAFLEKQTVKFQLPPEILGELKQGEFYKVQLAYIKTVGKSTTVGIYSTIGVTKYTTSPSVTVEGLNKDTINNHLYSYTGVYRQLADKTDLNQKDSTEKLYSSRFVIYDLDGNIVKDSGDILHNTTNDTKSYEATENFMIADDLDLNKIYYLYYIATTVNGLVKESPRYRITQRRQIPMNLEASIKATLDYEAGVVNIDLISAHKNQVASGQFLLSRKGNDTNQWEELFYFSFQSEIPDRRLFVDYTVAQGVKYTYSIQQYNENNVFSDRNLSNPIVADFEDLFLYDGKRQLKVKFNPKVSTFKPNVVESKVNTLGSKHPFITRNAKVNYKELAISGLISYQMDDIEKFYPKAQLGLEYSTHNLISENIKAERDFKLQVLEWLNDGEPKLFRSPTEGNYIVRLMNVSMSPTDTLGRMLHTFTCNAYEIDDYNYDNLRKYGLISVDNALKYQMRWMTIDLAAPDALGKINYFHGQVNIGNNYGELTLRPVYSLSVSEMQPGTYFLLGDSKETAQKIYIGTTGAYDVYSEKPYNYVGIPEFDEAGNPVEWDGLITYGYKSQITSIFDLITNVEIDDIPCRRLIGQGDVPILDQLQDIKTSILAIKYVNFSIRGVQPLYVDRSTFIHDEPSTWDFYAESNRVSYYKNTALYPEVVNEDNYVPIPKDQLNKWNIYKIYWLRDNYDYQNVAGEGYYVDRVKHEQFSPYTGFYFDPSNNRLWDDYGQIFTINVNGETADLSETEHLKLTGIENYNILTAGPGVVVDIGYQAQTSTYNFETNNISIRALKENYERLLEKYMYDRTHSVASSDEVKAAYKAFLNELTKVVTKYKEENSIA